MSQKKRSTPGKAKRSPEDERARERNAACIAIRCAAAVGQALRASTLLVGDPEITSQSVGAEAVSSLPDFLPIDLIGSLVIGERKRVYNSKCTSFCV